MRRSETFHESGDTYDSPHGWLRLYVLLNGMKLRHGGQSKDCRPGRHWHITPQAGSKRRNRWLLESISQRPIYRFIRLSPVLFERGNL